MGQACRVAKDVFYLFIYIFDKRTEILLDKKGKLQEWVMYAPK